MSDVFEYFPRTAKPFQMLSECGRRQFNPIPPGLFEGGAAGGGGEEVPAAYNSKTINGNEMKLGGVVKDH